VHTSKLDPAALPGAVANHFLAREQWARERLAAHAGRVFVLAASALSTSFAIDAEGHLESTLSTRDSADVTLRVSPLAVPALLADPARWDELVTAEGDPALIATLKDLAVTLPWFVEKAFASVLGPIAGQRVADAGRRLLLIPEYAGTRIGASVAAYVSDEGALATRRIDAKAFAADVESLAARADALEERVDALAARAARAPVKGTTRSSSRKRPADT
jgi:ubiquinone biosynthesis accessory factor UbiJ